MGATADFLKMVDVVVGRPLCVVLGSVLSLVGRRGSPASPPRRVLVIRPGGIGDAVLFIPLLQQLRRDWPEARIDLLMERRNAGVVAGSSLADAVLCYDRFPGDLWRVLRGKYDVVVDTEQYHCLSAVIAAATRAPRRIGFGTNARRRLLTDSLPYDQDLYEVHSFLTLARAATGQAPDWDPEQPFYPIGPEAREFAAAALRPLAGRTLVAIHPGASIPERRWPAERYAALAETLAASGLGLVILGGRTDRAAAEVIENALHGKAFVNLAGRTTLAQAAAVTASVAVYVSADTGVLHLAYAVGAPSVHLFGPGVLTKWGPPGRRFTTIDAHVPCSPCTIYGYTPPCCQGMICMLGITPEGVRDAVLAQLRAQGKHLPERAGEAAP